MFVLHAVWTRNALCLWAESGESARTIIDRGFSDEVEPMTPDGHAAQATAQVLDHPFALATDSLTKTLEELGVVRADEVENHDTITLQLPYRTLHDVLTPEPSERLASLLSLSAESGMLELNATRVGVVRVRSEHVAEVLLRIEDRLPNGGAEVGHDMLFWIETGRLALDLLQEQRFIPTMTQQRNGALCASWMPWLNDRETSARTAHLLASTPAVVCSVVDDTGGDAWMILEGALRSMCDATVRRVLIEDNYPESIDGRDLIADQHAGWLAGLLNGTTEIPVRHGNELPLLRSARQWIAHLDDASASRTVRLCMQLTEPSDELSDAEALTSLWRLSFHLVTTDDPPIVIDAEQVWSSDAASAGLLERIGGEDETAADVLLAELGRAARLWPRLEESLTDASPIGLDLSLSDAYEFLRAIRPILDESGVEILIPSWWGHARSRLAAQLIIESETLSEEDAAAWRADPSRASEFGLNSKVDYSWRISLGERPVSIEDFRELARRGTPLVRLDGQWIEIRSEDVAGAERFVEQHPGGRMSVLEAMRLANGVDNADDDVLPVMGMQATGWVAEVFGIGDNDTRMNGLEQPELFRGTLRPYQLKGLSWLVFLGRFGLGACLADDMGLGKTIQIIALLQYERQVAADPSCIGPTLLVVPMSVLGNWKRELNRFSPEIRVHVQHGLGRPMDDEFRAIAASHDVIVTTYSLVTRDCEMLQTVDWWRVTLDEAQHIKNPPTKQTAAIRALESRHRIALTGTPVENRLTELWSIMEFCCPGYLGTTGDFRRRFAIPIERHRDEYQAHRLRALVQPFVLRRLKTDKNVITDLPPLVTTKQTVTTTPEQARLYDTVVEKMLHKVDNAEGIRRRGLVLASLVKLKQICNHPAHYLQSVGEDPGPIDPARSGKATRLIQMLEEVIATGDRALIFTQYRKMGHLLVSMLRHEFDIEPLFLHGGTAQLKRDQLVERFQSGDPASPIFILSLKAGGVGLNLTSANHVFHFDRWWNPAVENQATDRAFRIGQNKTVSVHKLISIGTLEERVDQMIEEKTKLAEQIIGTGESWLTELSAGQLRDLLTLRHSNLEATEE